MILMFERNEVSQAKWKTTIGWGTVKEAPVLTNDAPCQELYGPPGSFLPSFLWHDPEDSPYHRMESQNTKEVPLPHLCC